MSGAIAGLAIGVVSTGISFAQANKQRNLQQKAEREADAAMQTARGKLDVNFAEQQAIKKESYELERDANLSAGAQAMAAGVEGGARGGAATAGRVLAQQNLAQSGTRVAMGEEMTNIEGAIIEEDSRLRDLGVALDLEEVAGNQQKAADAQAAADAAKQQGVKGVVNIVGQAAEMVPLYQQKLKQQKGAIGGINFNAEEQATFTKNAGGKNPYNEFNSKNISGMNNSQFRKFNRNLTPAQRGQIYQNKSYIEGMNTKPLNWQDAFSQ
jgi:hypothetical protein